MFETDGAVESSGVSGTDPEISAAAAECVRAHGASEMVGVTAACRRIRARVKELETAKRAS